MASDSIKLEIFKNGQQVAEADNHVRMVELNMLGLPRATAFHIPRLELQRMVIFDHLAGAPLSQFLHRSGVRVHYLDPDTEEELDADMLEPMIYVHGRSETARGEMTVSSVVLLWFDCPPNEVPGDRELMPQLPVIYKEVAKLL